MAVASSSSAAFRVAVIGAGPAGLCALKHMVSDYSDMFVPVVFERNNNVGGAWLYTSDTSKRPLHSAVYDSMRTNLPKEIMPYEGFPFPNNLPSFVHHSDFLKYLESFVDHFKLRSFVRFNTDVIQVVPKPQFSFFLDGTTWEITTKNLQTGNVLKECFDAVIICNGHYTVPDENVKGLANFKGTVMHSQVYRNPKPFQSQNVLVVGSSSSGVDISVEVATAANYVYLSQGRRKLMQSAVITPDNLKLISGTRCIEEDGSVSLDDGNSLQVDSIILCTGYKYSFPFLSKDCSYGISVSDHRVHPIYKHIFNIQHPSMVFIGLNLIALPILNFQMQLKFVFAVFSGSVQLPDKDAMIKDEEADFQEKLCNGFLPKDAHRLNLGTVKQWHYYRILAQLGNFKGHEQVIENIYEEVSRLRLKEIMTYKDYNIDIVDRENCIYKIH